MRTVVAMRGKTTRRTKDDRFAIVVVVVVVDGTLLFLLLVVRDRDMLGVVLAGLAWVGESETRVLVVNHEAARPRLTNTKKITTLTNVPERNHHTSLVWTTPPYRN